MTRVTYGVTCSPYVAISTTWHAADDAGLGMEEDAESVRRNLYVDDYLDSTTDLANASRGAKALREVLVNGDFHLGQWASKVLNLLDMVQSMRLRRGRRGDTGKGCCARCFTAMGPNV